MQGTYLAFEAADAAPPFALAQPGRAATNQHADNENQEDHSEQGQSHRIGGGSRREWIERHRHGLPIGDREGNNHPASGTTMMAVTILRNMFRPSSRSGTAVPRMASLRSPMPRPSTSS